MMPLAQEIVGSDIVVGCESMAMVIGLLAQNKSDSVVYRRRALLSSYSKGYSAFQRVGG